MEPDWTGDCWIVWDQSDHDELFSVVCDSDPKLILYARIEQDERFGLDREIGLRSPGQLPEPSCWSNRGGTA
jgi:hypothetical protein